MKLTQEQASELHSCFSARLSALDKMFKSCIKSDVKSAADKIAEKIRTVQSLRSILVEAQ